MHVAHVANVGAFIYALLGTLLFKNFQVEGLCGYLSCPQPKPGYLNVHLVSHSHDDVGWLKTIDQYYYGSNNSIQRAAVQYTLDSVVGELQKDSDRRFIYVETAFFWRWWRNQDKETQDAVRALVNNGQLEFISGGWSMNDEACTHYSAIIDQMSLGLRYLNDTFGECAVPKVAWQIDPFGHSREQASLFAQMGFDGLFFGRMDYQYRSYLKQNRIMEMVWNGSPKNLGKSSWLFTGVLFNYYQPPDGFCFDVLCDDDPIQDDPKLADYNVEEKVRDFIRIAKQWAAPYETKHVLMTMGSDFHYMAAHTWFKNLDKLIKYVNLKQKDGSRVNLFYSTPSCYLQEVHKTGKPLPMKTDDFFPYSNDPFGFWSGFFSSRPTFKYLINHANNFLQVCKQLAVGAFQGKPRQAILDKVFKLAEPVAVVQHHDGITGTAKQHVTDDYSLRLSVGIENCDEVLDEAFRRLRAQSTPAAVPQLSDSLSRIPYTFCHLLNISACTPSEEMQEFIVSIYNPLAKDRNNVYIRIPVTSPFWIVKSENGLLLTQITAIPKQVQMIPGRSSKAVYELVFRVNVLAGLTLTNFHISKSMFGNIAEVGPQLVPFISRGRQLLESPKNSEDVIIKNSKGVTLIIDGNSGLLKSVMKGSVNMPLKQNFYYYLGMAGNNTEFKWRASGAYILRPNTTNLERDQPTPVVQRVLTYEIFKGPHVTEVHQVFTGWLSQVIRLYETKELVEFEWLIGPIPISDGYGKEIVTRYTTDIPSNQVFFTDSNGRELIKRKRDARTYPFRNYEKVAGNYYPVPSRMIISSNEDLSKNGQTVVVLNDRSQGGTSMNDGEIELLLHRRLLYDDAFGVGEALNETAYGVGLTARGKHWLLLAGEGTGNPISKHRDAAQAIFMDNVMGFTDASLVKGTEQGDYDSLNIERVDAHLSSRRTIISELTRILPTNIHLLTVEPVALSQFLLRLEHFYETDEDEVHSRPVKLSLRAVMQALPFIKSMRETTLGGNQWSEDVRRFEWVLKNKKYKNYGPDDEPITKEEQSDDIVFSPMQIRSFLVRTTT